MHRTSIQIALLVLLLRGIARADAPASQPSTRPVDTSTPAAFLDSYDQLAGQGPEAYRALYSIDANGDTERLAATQAKFDAEAGMLQKIVADLWGADAVDQTLHALGLKNMRDIKAATIKENGTKATVTFSDGTTGPELVKTSTGWRLSLSALRESLGVPVDDYLKQIRQISKIIPDVADGIASGKLKSSTDVVTDIAKRTNPI